MITTYKDYMPKVYEMFPDIDKKDLDLIVRHGLYIYTMAHCWDCQVKACNANTTNIISTQLISLDTATQFKHNSLAKRRSKYFKSLLKKGKFV